MSARYCLRPRPQWKLTCESSGSVASAPGGGGRGRGGGEIPPPRPFGVAEPALGIRLVAAAERDQVRSLTNVVNGDETVGEHHHCVGKIGAVHVGAAAVGLQLVAEVADEAAEQPRRQAGRRG